ncbi:putative beta-1,3-galactosyltransferase 12 [Citrus sinensis]|nr:putative beta-1,3-galactosyltransferase 12 [Citrus sinensis]
MPLFSHRHNSSALPTSTTTNSSYSAKDQKLHKLNSKISLPILLFSLLSIFFDLAVITFAVNAVRRPSPLPVYRCGRSEDTFRAFYSLSDSAIMELSLIAPSFSGLLEQATGIAFRFVIGKSKDAKKMAQLEKEIDKLAYFRAAFLLFEAAYYVKADDDIYLRLASSDRLATLLAKERSNPLTCIGCMKKGHVITDPKMKWYEKSGHLIGNEYFLHAYGPIYVLSAYVVASLAAARNNSLRMFSNEDVTIGSWMLAMNVHHEDNRAICDPRCTSTSIAVWDIPKCSEAMSSTKSIPFQYLIAALIAILKHFYGTEPINAFAEGAAGAGQFKCTENAFGEVYRGYCSFVVV